MEAREHPLTMELSGPRTKLLTTYRLLKKPGEYFPKWKAQYGDPFLVNAVNGRIVLTGRPDLIKQIFAADPSHYDPFGVDAIAPLLGSESLLLMKGDAHRAERKLLMPPFHGKRMRAYAGIMRDAARSHIAAACGGPVAFCDVTQALTLEVILRAVFGVVDSPTLAYFRKTVVSVLDAVHPSFMFAPFLQRDFGGFGPYAKFRRAFETLEATMDDHLERVRAKDEPGEDILSMMLAARYDDGSAMSDAHIKDELRTIVTAGHETTALALAWATDLVHRHPRVAATIRADVDALGSDASAEDIAKLRSVDDAIKETLRLRPILTEALRTLRKPLTLGGLEIPAGHTVAAVITLVHGDPDIYPDPEAFRPERFSGRSYKPNEYLPYGGGHRRCIGAAFADFELRIALATLVAEFDVELLDDSPPKPVRRNITMAPDTGVRVRLRPRAR